MLERSLAKEDNVSLRVKRKFGKAIDLPFKCLDTRRRRSLACEVMIGGGMVGGVKGRNAGRAGPDFRIGIGVPVVMFLSKVGRCAIFQ